MSDNNGRQLPAGWTRTALADVVDILDSERVPVNSKERAKRVGDIPYYGATGQVGWIDRHLFDEDLVLLGEDGAPFFDPTKTIAYMIRGKSWVNNHAHVLRGRSGVLNQFLLHQLNQVDYHGFVSGTTRPKLPQGPMRQIPFLLPPEPEQQRIIDKLEELFSDLDTGVAALERVRRNLKRYRASVLKAAVEGRLTEAWRAEHPDVEPASELLTRILKGRRSKWEKAQIDKWAIQGKPAPEGRWKSRYVEPSPVEEDGHVDIPKDWTWTNLDTLTFFTIDYRGKTPPTAESGVPIISAANVKAGSIVQKKLRFVSEKTYRAWTVRGLPRPGDLIITTEAPVAEVALYPEDQAYLLTRRVFGCQTNGVDNRFLVYYLMSNGPVPYLRKHIRGSTVPRILKPALLGTPIPLPPVEEQEEIVSEVERRLSVIDNLEQILSESFRRAPRLRQSILKRAFEGKLVPQDSNDEPASVLLDRIRADRAANCVRPRKKTVRPRRRNRSNSRG